MIRALVTLCATHLAAGNVIMAINVEITYEYYVQN